MRETLQSDGDGIKSGDLVDSQTDGAGVFSTTQDRLTMIWFDFVIDDDVF